DRASNSRPTSVVARCVPSSTLRATAVPSRAAMTMTPSAPPLQRIPSSSITTVLTRPGPSIAQGVRRMASVSRAASGSGLAAPTGREGRGEAAKGAGGERAPASVDPDRAGRPARDLLDRTPEAHLGRMRGVQVALRRPAVLDAGEQDRGVLARAIHGDAALS